MQTKAIPWEFYFKSNIVLKVSPIFPETLMFPNVPCKNFSRVAFVDTDSRLLIDSRALLSESNSADNELYGQYLK